jgi:hypothetical protein
MLAAGRVVSKESYPAKERAMFYPLPEKIERCPECDTRNLHLVTIVGYHDHKWIGDTPGLVCGDCGMTVATGSYAVGPFSTDHLSSDDY